MRVRNIVRVNAAWLMVIFIAILFAQPARAQTPAFSYQGSLNFNGIPANGSYDFQFALYDVAVGGNPLTSSWSVNGVSVTNGIFSATLFFGLMFPGADRFIEIRARPVGGGAHTVLTPRQQILSAPYAIKAVNATSANSLNCFNCITSEQIASVGGGEIIGTIPVSSVPAGSTNYVQNGSSQQASANFNISGTGTAQLFNAQSQFNIGGERVLSRPNSATNTAVGTNASVNSGITNSTALGTGAVATTNNTITLGRTTGRVIAPGSMIIGNQTSGRGELSIYPSGTNADLYLQALGTDYGINIAAAPEEFTPEKSKLVISSLNGVTHNELVSFRRFETSGLTSFSTSLTVGGSLDVEGTIEYEPRSGMASSVPVCRVSFSSGSVLANCFSFALRDLTNVNEFRGGIDAIRKLRPVTFNWKED